MEEMTNQLKRTEAPGIRVRILGEREFRRLGEFIQSQFGIRMPSHKKTMLQSRLQKRLRHLDMSTFKEYCDYLFSDEGMRTELVGMVDAVTTNKTDFFREPDHFESLTEKILPTLAVDGVGTDRELRVWSAGCSTGEEPYTIAIVLDEYVRNRPRYFFSVVATDISERVLAHARQAVYDTEKIALPQVKVSSWQKDRLYGFLRIFRRKYADFIRDTCDAIIKWRFSEGNPTFQEHMDSVAKHIMNEYRHREYTLFKIQNHLPVAEQIQLHHFPTKKIERLPKVTVSKWQADNLHRFLEMFSRDYADFVRTLCENIMIETFEACAETPQFSKTTNDLFLRVLDDTIEIDKLRGQIEFKFEWPTDYWGQRRAAISRKRFLGRS